MIHQSNGVGGCKMQDNDFDDIKELREEALSTIMKLPEEKQIEMWNILRRLKQ